MRLLGNILWHIPFLGFVTAFFTFILGFLLTVTIVAAPIGLGLMQFSKFLLAPFSYSMISKADLDIPQNPVWRAYSFIIMILYLPIGLVLTVINIVQLVGLFVSVAGIPVAIVLAKSLGVYLNPVNKICVPVGLYNMKQQERDARRAQEYLAEARRR